MSSPKLISAKINYGTPLPNGEKFVYWIDSNDPRLEGRPKPERGHTAHDVQIEDLRGKEDSVSLDTHGFKYFQHETKVKDFSDDATIKAEYYPESEEVIKKLTGAKRVVFFDHTVRRRIPGQQDTPNTRQPAQFAHVDQTPAAAIARVHRHLPEALVPELLAGRYQIINLWRPISHPAHDHPLALCDYRSIDFKRDLEPATLRYPDRDGETFGVNYHPDHKWKYVSGLRPDEGVLIKCSDSIQDGSVAVLTPHTAFQDPTTPEGAPARESIELRSLVFY